MADEPRPVLGDRRMSDVEALMWNIEKDPFLASTFGNVTVLDRVPDVERLRRRLDRATRVVPRLRQRVAPALGRLAPPEWIDDPDLDLDFHVRRVAVPAPGDDAALCELAAVVAATPLDRTRPLWEFTVVEGLTGGRAAVLQKIHHAITDGEGGVRMSAEFIDLGRDEPEPPELPAPEPGGGPDADDAGDGVQQRAGLVGTAVETATHNLRRQLGIANRALNEAADIARHPDKIGRVAGGLAATVASAARQLAVTDPARSPLWTERSLRRRFEVLRISLDDAKRAAKALGGSVNDLFVAGAAGAAGAYHRERGQPVEELRISMPISQRRDRSMGGNAFTPARLLVPTAIEDPAELFEAVRDRLSVTKGERALGLASAMAGVLNVLPTSVLVRFARQQVETVDFTTSNVRGAPFDLYIAGAKILANYPMGPVAGTAFNLTTLSSAGWLDMGLHVDAAAVDDPARLRQLLEEAYRELLAAGGVQ